MRNRARQTIEVDLDQVRAEKLAQLLAARGKSAEEFFRDAIDEAVRLEQVARLAAEFRAAPLTVPDLQTLRREVLEAACPGDLCLETETGT